MLTKVILILISVLRLKREYIGLKGKFKKAKIFHSITSITLLLMTAYSLSNLQTILLHFHLISEKYSSSIGYLNSTIRTVIFYYDMIISSIIFITTFFIMDRNEKARKLLIKLVIMLIPSSALTYYELQKPVGFFSDITIIIIGFSVYTILFGTIALIYNSQFIIDFFDSKRNKHSYSNIIYDDQNK